MITGIASEKRKKIFLIRPGFWNLDNFFHPIQADPPLDLKYAAGLLNKSGHSDVEILDCFNDRILEKDLVIKILEKSPLAVIISIAIFNHRRAWELARSLKIIDNRIIIIAAGHDPTVRTKAYSSYQSPFDIVLERQFEEGVVDVVNKLNKSTDMEEFKKIHNKQPIPPSPNKFSNLDNFFPLEYTPKDLKRYTFIYPVRLNKKIVCGYIMSSRGCTHNCIFCTQAVRKTYAKEMQFRTASSVADEIEQLINQGANLISFLDDNFSGSRSHVLSICQEITRRELKVPWVASARIDELDCALLEVMKKAGCILLLLSVESGVERIIKKLNKTQYPNGWVKKAEFIFAAAQKIGIETCALFMVGNPEETKEEIERSIILAKKLRPAFIKVHFFTPYPGTAIYETIKDSVPEEALDLMHHYFSPVVNLSAMDMARLKMAQGHFYKKFFFRPGYIIQHLIKYSLFYLYNINVFKILSSFIYKMIKDSFNICKNIGTVFCENNER